MHQREVKTAISSNIQKETSGMHDWEFNNLPPEVEEGNVEYKLKLLNPTSVRIEHLVTQMKWRLQEGQGEAIYKIGVEDSGLCAGLNDDDMKATMNTLELMASRLGAIVTVLRKRDVNCNAIGCRKQVAEILVRRVPDDQQFLDIRISVVGNADTGKSTLLSVLTQGQLDNGKGRARLNLFRHLHEMQTGRTSCISHEILGFDGLGKVINHAEYKTAEDICAASSKIITFVDLAGHHKYLKTTIFGLTSHHPDFAILVVSANRGVGTTREHLGLAMALKVPIIAVVTKIDLCPESVSDRACQQLERLLSSPVCSRIPFRVCTEDDAYTAAEQMAEKRSKVVPIFKVSSVSGKNIPLLTKFLNVLPPRKNIREQERLMQEPVEFQVDEIYSVPEVGVVVGGTLFSGVVAEGDKLQVGPTARGCYRPATVATIHRNRVPCRVARAGQAASISLSDVKKDEMRKGMVMVSISVQPSSCMMFDATVYVLYHPTSSISEGFQCTVHVGNVRQTATIVTINNDKKALESNQQAKVTFKFCCYPEYLRPDSTVLFRERTTKGMGQVTKVYLYNPDDHVTSKRQRPSRDSSIFLSSDVGSTSKGDSGSASDGPSSAKRQHVEI